MQDTDPVTARLAAAEAIRRHRTARGLSMQQLSRQTGIPVATLEALEQGWTERLSEDCNRGPELGVLAEVLWLPIRVVEAAAWPPPAGLGNSTGKRLPEDRNRGSRLEALTGDLWLPIWTMKAKAAAWRPPAGLGQLRNALVSLNDLDRPQGLVIYGLLVAVLLYGLNLQQRRLAAANLLSPEPIGPLPLEIHLSNTPVRLAEQEQVETVNPAVEFQPLARLEDPAIRRQLLQEALQSPDPAPRHGLLEVTVTSPAQVILLQQGAVHAQLEAESGVLRWRLQPAFSLTVVPAGSAVVRWNQQSLTPLDEGHGRFRVDAP